MTTIGKYELGRKLGQGSFGLVYVAQDTKLDREVAIKLVHPSLVANAEVVRRFVVEARSAAKIVHPGIVTVYECGQVDDVAYIAMELLHGESLSDRLARAGQLAAETAAEIGRQLASALEAAHRAGVIHRDLKPDNIFLVTDPAMPEGERVKVLDFGIAKLAGLPASAVQTQSLMVFGTPRYMSPEQCRSAAQTDHRSDIYTLGCILFELVVGAPPFDGAVGDVMAKHIMIAPPTPRSAIGEIPAYLDELIGKMLAKDPAHRPQSMAAVQAALEAGATKPRGIAPTVGVTGSVVRAPVPTTLGVASGETRSAKPRRSRWALAIGALIGVVFGVGVLVMRRDAIEPLASPPPPSVVAAVSEPPPVVVPPVVVVQPPPTPVAKPAKKRPRVRPAVVATAPAPAPPPPCDAAELERTGQAAYVAGKYAAALVAFESANQCKPSGTLATKAVMAACGSGNAARARQLWRVLSPA
ncbi:MAG: serine/threonine-protein kinase, partial [Kofleriaceae bacterium]